MTVRTVCASFLLLSLIVVAGCGGKSDEPGALEKLQQQAEGLQKAAEGINETMSKQQEPVPPVKFTVLIEYLPKSVADMPGREPEGETASMGEWNFSSARNTYEKPDGSASAEVQIFDYAHIGMLYAPYQMLMAMGYNRESTKGYERSTKIGGFPAFEKWEKEGAHAEVSVLVGERFIVTVNTRGVGDGSARKAAEAINLSSLATQKAS